jgi:MFS-type transporter involved in bile tolerance (Atg22 family)
MFQSITSVFISFQTDFIIKRFNIDYVTAGQIGMIPYSTAVASILIWGNLIKRFPHKRRVFMICLALIAELVYTTLFLLPNT